MTETLYKHLLRARDPRAALIDVRHELARAVPQSHDWASIVCYLTLAPDFANSNWRAQIERLRQYLLKSVYEQFDNPKASPPARPPKPSKASESLFTDLIELYAMRPALPGSVEKPLPQATAPELGYAQAMRKHAAKNPEAVSALQRQLQRYQGGFYLQMGEQCRAVAANVAAVLFPAEPSAKAISD